MKGKEEKARNGGGIQTLAPAGVSRPGLREPQSSRVYCPTRQINLPPRKVESQVGVDCRVGQKSWQDSGIEAWDWTP